MEYNNIKMFKSRTVELGGNKFVVSHKSSGILSNNIWIYLGVATFYGKKIYKKFFEPIVKQIKEWSDLFFLLFLILGFISIIIFIVSFPIASTRINHDIHECIDEGLYCNTLLMFCEKEYSNSVLKHELYGCLYNIMNQNYWTEYKNNFSYWIYQSFYYITLIILSCIGIVLLIRSISFTIHWSTKKIIDAKNSFCDNIPEIEMV